jgi:hypothetical protein
VQSIIKANIPQGVGARAPKTKELGISGVRQSEGYIDQEFLPNLRGRKGLQAYIEMRDNDPIIGAILQAITMLIRNVRWDVIPAEDSQEGLADKEFVKGALTDMNPAWDDTVSSILSFLWAGWSLHEVVLKKREGDNQDELLASKFTDGRFGWRSILSRAQETIPQWQYDESDRRVIGAWQVAPPNYQEVFLPASRTLLFRTMSAGGNPEGRSVLRNAYVPYMRKTRIEEIEGIGIERDLAGLAIAWVPPELLAPGADAETVALLNAIKDIVTSIRRDEREGLIFPIAYDPDSHQKLYDLTLLTTGGRRQYDTTTIINRYNQVMSMTVLADFILLGHGETGSFALAESKTDIFGLSVGAYLGEIASVMNRLAIPRLFRANGMTRPKYPQLTSGDIETVDLKELGDYITKLAQAGVPLFPSADGALERYVMEQANLPTPSEQERVE